MTTVAAFVIALGVLIVFHEFGHYLAARLCGVKVLRFAVGFGRPLASVRLGRDGTEWVLAAFPLGGYVKMLDEREGSVAPEEAPRAFNRQNVWRRFAIVVAGPLANFLLAILLYWALFVHGVVGVKPVLGPVPAGSPAAVAHFQEGETITRIGGEVVLTWQDVRWLMLEHALEKRQIEVETRDGREIVNLRRLDLSGLTAQDLDGDFLQKLGLARSPGRHEPVIGRILAGKPAEAGGLLAGDRIVRVNGKDIAEWSDFVRCVLESGGRPLRVEVRRDGDILALQVMPEMVEEGDHKVWKIGAAPQVSAEATAAVLTEVRYPLFDALQRAAEKTWETSVFSLKMLAKMIVGEVSLKNISGPVTIADYAGQSAQLGLAPYLSFLALISISLGVLNLLPIPLLDGGHLMYYIAEIIKGSPVSERVTEIGQQIGLALLFTLMALAFYNDINRLVSG